METLRTTRGANIDSECQQGLGKSPKLAKLSFLFLGVAPLHVDALPTTLPTAVHFETVPFGTETSPPKAFD